MTLSGYSSGYLSDRRPSGPRQRPSSVPATARPASENGSASTEPLAEKNGVLVGALVVGVQDCPICGAALAAEDAPRGGYQVHECQRRGCGFKVLCMGQICVLDRVVTSNLYPCRFGHRAWRVLEGQGRVVSLLCLYPASGHRSICGEERRLWKGSKPKLPQERAESGATLYAVVATLRQLGPWTVKEMAAMSGLSQTRVRAVVKRATSAAVPLLKDCGPDGKVFDAASRRFLATYTLTDAGEIWLEYESRRQGDSLAFEGSQNGETAS